MEISETLVISFDSKKGNDLAALSVSRIDKGNLVIVNTFTGEEAEELYAKLTDKEKK